MNSKELGLVLAEKLLGLESLHYGYWQTKPQNFSQYTLLEIINAQKKYTKFLLAHIEQALKTSKTKRILDVGCGTGEMLGELLAKKYRVDGLIPSDNLKKAVEHKLQSLPKTNYQPHIYTCFFEQILSHKPTYKYDLVLFSESFQYIAMKDSFRILPEILAENGVVILCDFFKKNPHNPKDLHLVGGGHLWSDFKKIQTEIPFKKNKEIDITKNVSPTVEIGSYLLSERMFGSIKILDKYLQQRLKKKYFFVKKTLEWLAKKEFQKFQQKYLLGKRTGENFEKHNRYILASFNKKH